MNKLKLNFNQISGLITYSIGIIVQSLFGNPIGYIIILFGLLIFLISSNSNIGTIISLIVLVIGYLVKIMHFPYGNEIILFGIISFLVSIFFKHIYKNYKLNLILIYISLVILLLGIYFKISHLKYDTELIFIGYSAIAVSYSFRFIKKTSKNFEDYNKLLLIFFWSLSSLFNIFHWSWGDIFSLIFILTLWTWLIISMIRELRIKNE